jgi:hypothetical protein
MAKNWNRDLIFSEMNIDMSITTMHTFAGNLTGAASNASADVNIDRHSSPPGNLAG